MKKILVAVLLLSIGSTFSFAQVNVKGKVTDDAGEPLPGVAVIIAGTTKGTITEADGTFSLSAGKPDDSLLFTCLGYSDVTISMRGETLFNVVLHSSTSFIEESVVVGYGTMRKKDFTGAVSSIKSESLENRVLMSLDDALSEGVAGLMVSSASGKPGSASTMLIRGANSLTGSNAPLIVVDGFPLFDVSTTSGAGIDAFDTGMSSMSMINPDDVASIEVLKDASATAIYGNRGANGVIIITTKKGKEQGGKVVYNSYYGAQSMNRRYDMMDFNQYAAYQAEKNTSNILFYDADNNAPRNVSGVKTRNWQDEIFRTGFVMNQSVSVSQSTKKTNFFFSGSWINNQSILVNTNWNKFTAKAAIDHYLTDHVRMGIDINYSKIWDDGVPTGGEGTSQQAGVIINALTAMPFDLTDSDTQVHFKKAGVSQSVLDAYTSNYHGNPIDIAYNTQMSKNLGRLTANGYVEWDIIDDLVLKITGGYDDYNLKDRQYYPKTTPRGWFYDGQAIVAGSQSESWINENTLTWRPTFGKHRLNVLAGISEQGVTSFFNMSETTQFEYEGLGYNDVSLGKVNKNSSNKGRTTYLSFIGRANYSYDSRYLATFTFRRDGTSAFVKNKWGNFFSGAVAWNIDEEDFMKRQSAMSTAKLRLSIGQVGNSGVPTTGSYSQLVPTFYSFGGNPAIGETPASIANEDLTWETTTEFNIGLETGFLNDRITLNADLYSKITDGLLLEVPVVNIAGFDKAWQNIGKMRNRGLELSLNATLIEAKNFKWTFNANFTTNLTQILELGQNGAPIYFSVSCLGTQNAIILQEGGRVGDIYGYETIGVYGENHFEEDGKTPKAGVAVETGAEVPGSMRFADRNGDGKITAEDRTVIGNTMPDWYGAFGTGFTWKDFNLSAQFQYSVGADIYNANYNFLAKYNANTYNQVAFYEDRWTAENRTSTMYNSMTNEQICSAFVEDGSFLRLKNLKLTYTLPRAILASTKHIDTVRAYISADNLFVLTRYSGYDPEVSTSTSALTAGFDYGVFPRPTTFTLGFNLVLR